MKKLLLAMMLFAHPVLACAPAPHAGEDIDIVEESAVILWDPSTKTEQFIRRATFRGDAKDFGFLVPTPSAPALAEVNDDVFETLKAKTARKEIEKTTTQYDFRPAVYLYFFGRTRSEDAKLAAGAPVEVLATEKVAGYEAAVLDATDAKALRDWLEQHGYATTPDLEAWLDVYIQKQWKISAFKIDKSSADARTGAVRMSFVTDRPFFPYREPASQRESPPFLARALNIWFVGPERVRGTIGANTAWPHELLWSGAHDGRRLTAFSDTSTPRPGIDDLYFDRDPDQRAFVPDPLVIENYETT
ncbi:MAG TPA: DUF2330 domain-containing protein, partial [Thermoanaerobaculia bacterium]|nr:DUF2330 domain-containing protein [Thermoanaerobaculia bacterium]